MEHTRLRVWLLGLVAVAVLGSSVTFAQPDPPHENHYKVYVTPALTFLETLVLRDQINLYTVNHWSLERWANPAEKFIPATGERYPPVNPFVHLMWWRGNFPTMEPREIIGIDQFGTNKWTLTNPEYLVTPALKNVPPPGEPPVWNHYLCYRTLPGNLGRFVVAIDQFGQAQLQLVYINYFCNPVEKRRQDGRFYPIVDPKAHLACYQFFTNDPLVHPITAIDQFGNWVFDVRLPQYLCVPALKEHVVKTEQSTWGKIKAMYQ